MAELRWIRGAARTPRYVGTAGGGRLYAEIDDLPGLRGAAETLALHTVGRVTGARVEEPAITDAWTRVQAVVPDVARALFVHTGYYKDTLLSGVVEGGRRLFVKAFREQGPLDAERGGHDAFRAIVPDGVVLASVTHAGERVLAYELLPHARRRVSGSELEALALRLGANGLAAARPPTAGRDALLDRLDSLLAAFGRPLPTGVTPQLAEPPPQATAHGDFTPWNVFRTREGRLAVVDYERVGPRAPYADAWHLATQPVALAGHTALPADMLARVGSVAGADRSTVLRWYAAYLVEELEQDAADWVERQRRYSRLSDVIATKSRLLEAAVAHLD